MFCLECSKGNLVCTALVFDRYFYVMTAQNRFTYVNDYLYNHYINQ